MKDYKKKITQLISDLTFVGSWFDFINQNIEEIKRIKDLFDNTEEYYSSFLELSMDFHDYMREWDNLKSVGDYLENETYENVSKHFKDFWEKDIDSYQPRYKQALSEKKKISVKKYLKKWSSGDFVNISDELNECDSIKEDLLDFFKVIKGKLYAIALMTHIKHIEGNIVIVGANGSGKSTYVMALSEVMSKNISFAVLVSQHCLHYRESVENIQEDPIYELHYLQKNPLDIGDEYYTSSMTKMILALLDEHLQCAYDYFNDDRKRYSKLQQVLEIWNDLFPKIHFKLKRNELIPIAENGEEYEFNQLSDGEKTAFYYIGHVILAETNSFIIVDEPENHLHSGLCKTLWNRLETVRDDCKYIYITHDLNFAETRLNSSILWNKQYISPVEWDVYEIEDIERLPEKLVLEMLGSKSWMILCEGSENSYDVKIYSALFPHLNIRGVGGHANVIRYVNGYRSQFTNHSVIGIIDRDWHSDDWCKAISKYDIIILKTNEIENILCDERIIMATLQSLCYDTNEANAIMNTFLNNFWEVFFNRIDEQALNYTYFCLNEKLRTMILDKRNSFLELSEELKNEFSVSEMEKIYMKRKEILNDIYSKKDYNCAIAIVNFKQSLLDIAKRSINQRFIAIALNQIRSRIELKNYLIKKYIGDGNILSEI